MAGGEHYIKDEPQHLKQGSITKDLLKLLNIKYIEIKNNKSLVKISSLLNYSKKNKKIVAILIKKNCLKLSKKINFKNIKTKRIDRSFFIKKLILHTKKNLKLFQIQDIFLEIYTDLEIETKIIMIFI